MWIVSYNDIINYTNSDNLVTNINLTQYYREIGILKDTANFDLNGNRDLARGVTTKTTTFQFSLGELTIENREFIRSLLLRRVSILFKLNNRYYVIGLDGGLKLTSWNGTSGRSASDNNGYTLTFTENGYSFPKCRNKKYSQYILDDMLFYTVTNTEFGTTTTTTSTTTTTTTAVPTTTTTTSTSTTRFDCLFSFETIQAQLPDCLLHGQSQINMNVNLIVHQYHQIIISLLHFLHFNYILTLS